MRYQKKDLTQTYIQRTEKRNSKEIKAKKKELYKKILLCRISLTDAYKGYNDLNEKAR